MSCEFKDAMMESLVQEAEELGLSGDELENWVEEQFDMRLR
tara:strand:- start:28980 stop:29102 length:123 start_codon:yes stop_codon:yes gene_type:complete